MPARRERLARFSKARERKEIRPEDRQPARPGAVPEQNGLPVPSWHMSQAEERAAPSSDRPGGSPGVGEARVGHKRLVGQGSEELDQIVLLGGGDREAPDERALVAMVVPGAPAGGVVVDHGLERRNAPVVH